MKCKKVLAALLCALLVFTMGAVPAWALGSSISGPATAEAGDVITVSFRLSGCNDVVGVQGRFHYDQNQVELVSGPAVAVDGWYVQMNGNKFLAGSNTLTGLNGSPTLFTLRFRVKNSAAANTKISFSSTEVIANIKDSGDVDLANGSYTLTVVSPQVSSRPVQSETPNSSRPVSSRPPVESSSRPASSTGTTSSSDTSSHSDPEPSSQMNSSSAVDNRSSNANIASLTVEPGALSPPFSPDRQNYVVWLPYEVEQVQLTAEAEDANASVQVQGGEQLFENQDNPVRVTCTAENGEQKVYTVLVKRAINPDDDPGLLAANVFETTEEIVRQMERMGEAYPDGEVLVRLDNMERPALEAEVLNTLAKYPSLRMNVQFVGASLLFAGCDVTGPVDEEGYPLCFSLGGQYEARLREAANDPAAVCYTFGGGVLPGRALLRVETELAEGTLVNIYGYDALHDRYVVLATNIEVGENGLVSYRSAVCYDSVITTGKIAGAVAPESDGTDTSGGGWPLWAIWALAAAGAVLLVLFGLLIGRFTARQPIVEDEDAPEQLELPPQEDWDDELQDISTTAQEDKAQYGDLEQTREIPFQTPQDRNLENPPPQRNHRFRK
jgi:hypothetical protein